MNELIPLEFRNQRIMTTSVIAESYGTTEKVISNNFNRNKDKYKEGKHYFLLQGEELKEFRANPQIDELPLNINKLYLWTEKGALLHAKSLNTDKAWEVYDILVETYFRIKQVAQAPKQLTAIERLKLQNEAILEVDKKVDEVIEEVKGLKNNTTISYGQQEVINRTAKEVVVHVLGGKDAPAYKELNKKVFSSFWKDYKRVMQVASYRDTLVKDYDKALDFIIAWRPNRDLELMIIGCNSQINFKEDM